MKINLNSRSGRVAAIIAGAICISGAYAHETNEAAMLSKEGDRPFKFSKEIDKRLHNATCIEGKAKKGESLADHPCRGKPHLGHRPGMIFIMLEMEEVEGIGTKHNVRCVTTEINVLTSEGMNRIWPMAGSNEDKERPIEAQHCIP